MKSKRSKPSPPKKSTALRPYSVADFLAEIRGPIGLGLVDIVSRVHYLTGFDKHAMIFLMEEIRDDIGHELYTKLLNMNSPEYLWGGGGVTIGNVLSYLDSKIGGTTWVFCEPDENRLTIRQIALICRYNGRKVKKEDSAKIAQEYGHKGSTKLYDDYRETEKSIERITWAKESQKNRDKFEAIGRHLNDSGKAMWNDELQIISKRNR